MGKRKMDIKGIKLRVDLISKDKGKQEEAADRPGERTGEILNKHTKWLLCRRILRRIWR